MAKHTQTSRICHLGRIRRSKSIQLYFFFIALIAVLATISSYKAYYKRPDYFVNVLHTGQRSSEKQKNILNSPGYSIRVSETKQELLSSLNLNLSLLNVINQGNLFGVDPTFEQGWRRPTHTGAMLTPLNNNRKKITTYFNKNLFSDTALSNEIKTLDVWKRAMWVYGFDPVVLDHSDASSHELFPAFTSNKLIEAERKSKYEHIFAWARAGGGLYADYHLLPVDWPGASHSARDTSSSDLSIGDFLGNITESKMYNPYSVRLMEASGEEAATVASKVTAGQSNENIESLFSREEAGDVFAEYSEHYVFMMLNGEEKAPEGAVAEMMETHMHQSFLKRYIDGGIVIVHPMEDEAEIFTYPLRSLAKRLAQCPNSTFASTCPPTSQNLKKAFSSSDGPEGILRRGFDICGNPCAPDSPYIYGDESMKALKTRDSSYIPDDGNSLALIAVPHPVTVLSLLEKKDDVTSGDARSYLIRDSFIRQVTSAFLPANSVGMSYRLLLCKDSIYQRIQLSNIFWTIWEKFTTPSQAQLEKLISYEFGFRLPDESGSYEFEEATDVDDASEAAVISAARARALAVYSGETRKNDRDLAAIESWNAADTELWLFLDQWIETKKSLINQK